MEGKMIIISKGKSQKNDLCLDEIEQILLKLPAKTLLRLRCVSKYFLSLIGSPAFISKHLNLSKNNKDNTHVLLITPWHPKSDDLAFDVYQSDTLTLSKELSFSLPIEGEHNKYYVIEGHIDGLILLQEQIAHRSYLNFSKLLLCNPSIRKLRRIPPTDDCYICTSINVQLGIGFDPSTNDHKVLIVDYPSVPEYFGIEDTLSFRAAIFSLRLNSWKRLEFETSVRICRDPNASLNGAVHWLGRSLWDASENAQARGSHIVSFDMSSETFSYLETPDVAERGQFEGHPSFVVVLKGSLALVDRFYQETWIWEMEGDAWSKLYTINLERINHFLPVGGRLFAQIYPDDLKWYDLESGQAIDLDNRECFSILFTYNYVDSLFWYKEDGENAKPVAKLSLSNIFNRKLKNKIGRWMCCGTLSRSSYQM